jgi:UDPglucose--hexose-1-phosphate uridylyltransferase
MTALPASASPEHELSLVDGRPIVKREYELSDGRQLIYFDDADTVLAPDRIVDKRILDARPETPIMRYDVMTGEWVSIAPARNARVVLPSAREDPLAVQVAGNASEIPDEYDVAVFENRSPSFGPAIGDGVTRDGSRIELEWPTAAVGRCEVVSFSPEREGSLATQTTSRVRTVIEAWADRTRVLSALDGVEQVFPFENRGAEVGVTLLHPHGQIYAYPFVAPRTEALIRQLESYGNSLFDDILHREQASERLVVAGEHWTAYTPFAARWPIEVHVLPHRHIPDLAETDDAERAELAVLYPRVLRALDALYPTPTPYMSGWHQAPVRVARDGIRLMLQITSPRRSAKHYKYLAGSEALMGAFIGDVNPEDVAHKLRHRMETDR